MTDTTTTAPRDGHLVAVVSDGYEVVAECACGWASDWQDSPEAADAAGSSTARGGGSARRRGRAMSGLLDLQDDLAATVVWLAENWSADLPVPGLVRQRR